MFPFSTHTVQSGYTFPYREHIRKVSRLPRETDGGTVSMNHQHWGNHLAETFKTQANKHTAYRQEFWLAKSSPYLFHPCT